jgi:hypothetical protein
LAGMFEAKNFPKLNVSPASDDAENIARSKMIEAAHRLTVDRRRFWTELEHFLGGERGDADVSTRMRLSADGQSIDIATRSMVDDAWLNRPVLHLDATMNEVTAQSWLPRLDLTADIRVRRGEGVTVRQVTETVGYRKLFTPKSHDAPPELTALGRRVLRKVEAVCARDRKATGLIGPKGFMEAAEALWRETSTRPANLLTAHFGALRGLNEMEQVAHLIVVSRPEPQAAEIERIARPTFDQHPSKSLAGEFYPKRVVGLRMMDGGTEIVEEACHPDPVCHAVLEQVRDAEVAQAVHRARLVRRASDRPLRVDIVTSTAVDITIDEVMALDAWLEVSVDELLVARGMVPEDWAGKHGVLKDVFPTVDALKKAAGRAGRIEAAPKEQSVEFVTSPNRILNKEMSRIRAPAPPTWPRYRYRLAGKRKGSKVAIDPARHPDTAAAWAMTLGVDRSALAEWEPLDLPAEQPAAEQPRQRYRSPELAARLSILPAVHARRRIGTRPARELHQRRMHNRNRIAQRLAPRGGFEVRAQVAPKR